MRVAIVGAGITGLALAHELHRRGVPHVVLEASDRPGGVVRSGRGAGEVLEYGPQRTRMVGALRELVAELRIEDQVVTAPAGLPLTVYHGGRLRAVPFSAADFLRTDLLGPAAKARVLLEPLTAGPRPDERVAGYFVRKLGRDAYEHLVGPLYGGLYASDPADMVMDLSLAQVLREFGIRRSLLLPLLRRRGRIDPPAACSFVDGMETLPRALHARHADRIRLRTPVETLRGVEGGFALGTPDGEVRAESVVLTAPPAATARILADAAPDASARIASLRSNPLAVVHLRASTDLRGLGYQVSLAERLATRGVTFNDSLFGRTGIYTAYLGGAKMPEVVDWEDGRIEETAIREFRGVTGFDAEALEVTRERMPAWDVSWSALRGMRLPAGVHLAANWESRPGIPGRLAQARRLADALAR